MRPSSRVYVCERDARAKISVHGLSESSVDMGLYSSLLAVARRPPRRGERIIPKGLRGLAVY